jgi:hypothetical protein
MVGYVKAILTDSAPEVDRYIRSLQGWLIVGGALSVIGEGSDPVADPPSDPEIFATLARADQAYVLSELRQWLMTEFPSAVASAVVRCASLYGSADEIGRRAKEICDDA